MIQWIYNISWFLYRRINHMVKNWRNFTFFFFFFLFFIFFLHLRLNYKMLQVYYWAKERNTIWAGIFKRKRRKKKKSRHLWYSYSFFRSLENRNLPWFLTYTLFNAMHEVSNKIEEIVQKEKKIMQKVVFYNNITNLCNKYICLCLSLLFCMNKLHQLFT